MGQARRTGPKTTGITGTEFALAVSGVRFIVFSPPNQDEDSGAWKVRGFSSTMTASP